MGRAASYQRCCAASLVRQLARYGRRYYCGPDPTQPASGIEIVAIPQYVGRDASALNTTATAELWDFTVTDETWALVLPLVRAGRCYLRALSGDQSKYQIDLLVPSEPVDATTGRRIKTERIKS